ncbi:MAG TPA: TolC family protein [Stellaceae bacterium]|nr:TolC family protein [Stellaceae bacterium]
MRCARFSVIVACVVTPLLGCATYKPAPISPAINAAAIDARSLNSLRLREFIKAAAASDPEPGPDAQRGSELPWTLTTLTLAALYYHPDLDIARSKLAEARAGVITAAQVPNPSLSFEELSYNTSIATPSPWVVAPAINFLIETFGKREDRTAQARHWVQAARDDLATASWQVRRGVRNALINLWAARRQRTMLRQRLDLENQLVMLLEHRLAAGEASALDVARERINRDRISLAVRNAERGRVEARTELAAAIGIPVPALDGIALSFGVLQRPARPKADVATGALRREALVDRSDVQSLLAGYAAAESALALQIANQYPNIRLSPGYIYDQGQNKYMLLPAAALPVFNQNQGPIAEAMARRAAAAARFTALQTRIIDQVDGTAASYRAATQTLDTATALLTGEENRERRILRSFGAGAVDRPTLLTAEIERVVAEQSRFAAMIQQRQALGALEDALQHPFFAPTAALPVLQTNPRRPAEPSS